MDRKYKNLCSPLKVGKTVFRNRMFSAPMGGTDISNDGCIGDKSKSFYELRAKGGAAVVTVSELMVHPARQNQGLGTRLLLAVEQFYPGKRYELFTSSKSAGNIRLYEKLGYTVFAEKQSTGALRFVYLEKGAVGTEAPTTQT